MASKALDRAARDPSKEDLSERQPIDNAVRKLQETAKRQCRQRQFLIRDEGIQHVDPMGGLRTMLLTTSSGPETVRRSLASSQTVEERMASRMFRRVVAEGKPCDVTFPWEAIHAIVVVYCRLHGDRATNAHIRPARQLSVSGHGRVLTRVLITPLAGQAGSRLFG